MNIDPQLLQLIQQQSQQQTAPDQSALMRVMGPMAQSNKPNRYPNNWYPPEIRDAYGATKDAAPGQQNFNGIIHPGENEQSVVIDPDQFMADMAEKQAGFQPQLPDLYEMLQEPDQEKFQHMLRQLGQYNKWQKGQDH